jgi:tetratricopeptide (TPR) repeat protein
MGQDATEKQNNVTESLKKAREALALDIADPFSWYILGNAYLANFFVVSHNSVDIRNALKAYQKSEEQTSLDIRESPDFHYNRSVAFKYNADYQAALEDLVKALELDPGWRELELEIKTLDKFMQHMCALLKGKRRGKKEIATDHGLHGTSTTIKQLVLGSNPTLELCVRVVAIVPSPNPVLPLAAIISDCKGEWVVLSLRSVASGALQTGDNMTISQPILQKCKYEHGQTCFSYDHVVVDDPSHVAVHGKGPLCAAFPVFEMNPK